MVPVLELIECNVLYLLEQGRLTKANSGFDYAEWREVGAPPEVMEHLFSLINDSVRGEHPNAAAQIEHLEEMYASDTEVDPLIAVVRDRPFRLSTGEPVLFVIDGNHRLYAAAKVGLDEVQVYIAAA